MKFARRLLPPLLPIVIEDLSINSSKAGIAFSILTVFTALVQYPGGRLADQLSRKTVLTAGYVFMILGLVVLSNATTYILFLLAMAIIGVSTGLFGPADRAVLSDVFENTRGKAFGLHLMSSDIAGIIAPTIVSVVTIYFAWQSIFPPIILLLVALLVLSQRWSQERFVVSPVKLELRETGMRLFSTTRMQWLLLAYSLFVFASQGVISFLPTFLVAERGFSISIASVIFALIYAVGIITKPLAGMLSDRISRPVVAGSTLILGGLGLAIIVSAPTRSIIIAGVLIFALGQRAYPAPIQAYLMDFFPDSSMAADLGAIRSVYLIVGSLGPAYTGFVADHASFGAAYSGIVVLLLVAGGIVFSLLRFPNQDATIDA
jgi:predicted MFS family arabinose efflux permease